MVAKARFAAEHGSFNPIRQMAPICISILYVVHSDHGICPECDQHAERQTDRQTYTDQNISRYAVCQ